MPLAKTQWSGTPNATVFDNLQALQFPNVASIGAGVAGTTVQGRVTLPFAAKIQLVVVSFSAIQAIDGGHQFNVVVGAGTYETTAAAAATGTVVIAGTATTGQTITTTINGHDVVSNQTTGNTNIQDATQVVSDINADTTANKLVVASNVSGTSATVTLTALEKGTEGNAITLAATSSGGETATASGANLTGGTNASGMTTAPTDNSYTGPLPGGAGYPTVFAAAGNALFAANGDATLSAGAGVGVAASTLQPALAAITTSGGVLRYVPDVPDAIYPAGTVLTLRAITPTTVGSISNFQVTLGIVPVRTKQAVSQTAYLVAPGVDY